MDYTIAVFGLGFVGLTTALGFAEKGFVVYGYDIDKDKCSTLKEGKITFLEPGLDSALRRHIGNKFYILNTPEEAWKADIIFLCVGTPFGENGNAELKYLFSAIDSIKNIFLDKKERLIVVKSTVPPGTLSNKIIPYAKSSYKEYFKYCSFANNPEFLREGYCWNDFMNPDRIVCGTTSAAGENLLKSIYKDFNVPICILEPQTSEFIKYLSNTLLATLISYSNEMANIADKIGNIDVGKAFRILHMDKRIENSGISSYIYPGCGYGGYCLPKDTVAMASQAVNFGYEPIILNQVIKTNEMMPFITAEKIKSYLKSKSDSIGILGLSFKSDSDDVRDSPAAKIINCLISDGYNNIYAYDPEATDNFIKEFNFKGIKYLSSYHDVCEKSEVIALVTTWDIFKNINTEYPDICLVDCRYFVQKN